MGSIVTSKSMDGTGSVGTSSGMVDGHFQYVDMWLEGTYPTVKKCLKQKYHIFRKSPGKYQRREQNGQ